MQVTLIDQDREYCEVLIRVLSRQHISVELIADSEVLVDSFDTIVRGDIIILGPSLPKASGVELLSKLYLISINLPIIYLAGDSWLAHERSIAGDAPASVDDAASGVEAVAENLKLVINAIKPQPERQSSKRLVLGRLSLELDHNRAFWDKMEINLTAVEYDIVRMLALNFGRHLSYDAIYRLQRIGRGADRTEPRYRRTIVRSAVKRIRNKFRARDQTFVAIENYAAFGYRWAGPTND